ncbi:argininosuccinate synthase [Candidatus Nitrososphaera evergladensis SR1]|uniref:Argininosuccinate synthase n=1 Tax=Candidatus Nitrososphaera evergladensis SR1 TaxID=1459636 RepID=A0A075MU38_9ARCH|nr:argininosuccinate synthase [Candidatus Nitrososphaera evergladensis]AIF82809.1 argininosuccinate synthase [Candidatus Nitrososphaera evergladensis SR1]
MANKVVLAYSGGLDTSVCIRYLQTLHKMDVITVTVDCGQDDDFAEIERRAKAIGAIKHVYVDAKDEFARDYVIPSIKANGLYQGKYPLATALARPLIAAKTVEVATKENAVAIAHGCTGKGNDQIRFDVTMRALRPDLKIIAPIRDMNLTRDVEIKYAKEQNIPISTEAKKYSIDLNLWGRAVEGGNIEDADFEPPEEAFQYINFKNDKAGYVEIEFDQGVPVAADGKHMSLTDLIQYVNDKAGAHGVGIVDHIEDRVVGIKSREVYEAPAAVTIIEAHRDLEKMVLTKHELAFKRMVDDQWSWLAYAGLWQDPLRTDLDRFIDATQTRVSGKVRVKLQRGSLRVVGRQSRYSLYKNDLATYAAGSTFDQSLAKGFVELWGLQSIIANSVAGTADKKQQQQQQEKLVGGKNRK